MKVRWLGLVPYREAWDLQRALSRGSQHDYLILLEHPHVFTLGTNADEGHVLTEPASLGADLVRVDRGGDVTYHGPGQLVGYPLVTVGAGPHRGPEHVRRVEQVVIDVLVSLGAPEAAVGRLDGYPGVWAGLDEPGPPDGQGSLAGLRSPGPRKIAAIGVRTARGRTTHGFALNVRPDLDMFGHIVPCGIADKPVTSMEAEGWRATMDEVVDAVIRAAERQWGPVADIQRVAPRVPAGLGRLAGHRDREAPLVRRLRRSGVDPDSGLDVRARKPPWLRVEARMGDEFLGLRNGLRDLELVTVCEEAGCPNIYECWSGGTATFMINGSRCTRACGFCQVDTRHPLPLDTGEPDRVAEAVERMGLAHAVVTCVARDDLVDGGAGAFASTVAAIRHRSPRTTIELLVSDCKGDTGSLGTVFAARPDILNHNIETVARLQRAVRPQAGYARSLTVLARAAAAGLVTKSGIILGMGETEDEVLATLADLRGVGVEIVTIGQYLRPSIRHLPVARWWTPEEFADIGAAGRAMGFTHVQSSPLTRSSYHAREAAEAAVAAGSSAGPGPSGTARQPEGRSTMTIRTLR